MARNMGIVAYASHIDRRPCGCRENGRIAERNCVGKGYASTCKDYLADIVYTVTKTRGLGIERSLGEDESPRLRYVSASREPLA